MANKHLQHQKVTKSIFWGVSTLSLTLFFFIPYITEKYTIESLISHAKNSTEQIKLTRAYYVDTVVDDVKKFAPTLSFDHDHAGVNGKIPLPTTTIHDLSKIFSENTGLKYNLYSDYPFKNRTDRVLTPFQKEAIKYTKIHPDGIYIKRELLDGEEVLRVATTDFMTDKSCVECHNNHPDRTWPKNKWKIGDKRGVLEVITPIEKELADHTKMRNYILFIIFGIFGSVLIYLSKNILSREQELLNVNNELENEVQDKNQQLQTFHNLMDEHIITSKIDTKGIITYVSKAFIEISGYTEDELLGHPHNIIQHPDTPDEVYKDLWNTIKSGRTWKGEIRNRTKEGKAYWVIMLISPNFDKEKNIIGYSAIHHNITAEKQAKYLANHDYLTGLPNRATFEKILTHAIQLAHRDSYKLAILFIDLDNFKDINDIYGHDIGDKALKAIAQILSDTIEEGDSIARIGGDEFIILIEKIENVEILLNLVTNILKTIKDPIILDSITLHISVSIGIALYPDDGDTVVELMRNADTAMYHIKDNNKGDYKFYTKSISEKIQTRINIERELQNAIDNDGFKLVYQPKVELQTGKIIGCEALIRLKSSDISYTPDIFIPVAEENHMIIEIGDWVLKEACHVFKQWLETGIDVGIISVNVSSVQLTQKDFVKKVLRIIQETRIKPNQLELEITEHTLMDHNDKTINALSELRNAGVMISIDDFGTGYSSMIYLKQLPVDTIKIDKAFVNDIEHNYDDIEIIKAIVTLSKSLGYSIVVEGIENKEQMNILIKNGCEIGQGNLFSTPLAFNEFIKLFKSS